MNKIPYLALTLLVATTAIAASGERDHPTVTDQVTIPAGSFESVLPPAPAIKTVEIRSFRIDPTPVTNEQFLRFVIAYPEWQRGRVARVFADERYLDHWLAATDIAPEQRYQPVVRVSWFAASAYCESRGARLPTWHEWEYVAAASATERDGRADIAWRQQTLNLYHSTGRGTLPNVGSTPANAYGVRDLHGVAWEWVDDLSALLVSADNREQSESNALRFCGAGALTMEQKDNYAIVMRIALLSSMQAQYTNALVGFRCVTEIGVAK